ncbi:glutathione S-transferase family protein [Kiloniella antarctica]|uniref:Glutathione S-transferase family protein n=1 Tax=Kiloniella antarctica TaxID=1550907 RepID=A0ABW5BIP5_9PROT
MEKMRLIIGNKNYSSWSLRPWLAMKVAGLDFDEEIIPLFEPNTKTKLLTYSPVGTVPVLMDGELTVSDSLAILEYIAEKYPEARLLPQNPSDRAKLRSICCEMHSGFFPMRGTLHMNMRKKIPLKIPVDVQANVDRIKNLWQTCRLENASKGPFLFGHFTIADAMYAPVVSRFKTYGIDLGDICEEYSRTILNLPEMQAWYQDALKETWIIKQAEIN